MLVPKFPYFIILLFELKKKCLWVQIKKFIYVYVYVYDICFCVSVILKIIILN